MLKFNIPITGIIENMSFFKCDNCDKNHYIFGKNGVENLAKQFNTKVVAKLPIFNNSEKSFSFFPIITIMNYSIMWLII